MTDDPTGPTLDEEGLPGLQGPLPGKAATGDPQEGEPPPSTRPASLDWGVTAAEDAAGEPVSVRVAREQPDLGEPGALVDPGPEIVLVDGSDEDVGLIDDEKDAVARASDASGQLVGPEEAALHLVDDPDETIAGDPDAGGAFDTGGEPET